MEIPNYFEIMKKSLQIGLQKKYFWWFGLFISLGEIGGIFNFPLGSETNKELGSGEFASLADNLFLVKTTLLIFSVLFFVFFILGIIARGGMIKAIEKAIKGEDGNFRSEFREGRKFFWRILAINASVGFLALSAFAVLAVPIAYLFYLKSFFPGTILLFMAILIFAPIMILLKFIRTFGHIYAVSGNLKFFYAIENSYRLFINNIKPGLIMAAILIIINGLISVFAFSGIFILLALAALTGFIFNLIFGIWGITFVAIIFGSLISALFLGVKSIYETFQQTAWILFFHEIGKTKETEKEEPVLDPESAHTAKGI